MSEDWTEKKCSSVVVTQDGEKNRFLTCGSVSPISHLIFEVNSYEENDGSVFLPDEEVIEKEEEQRSISQSWKYLVLFSFCLGIISPLGILLSRNELAGWLTSLFIFIFSALTLALLTSVWTYQDMQKKTQERLLDYPWSCILRGPG
ncbi:uncharacterized protein LOC111711940 isoform X2 [Eurytemora carolleeae]|uniref:uncharacterized protein LOC111711940 isoform X2 n=1 Tax=Eurytemora carolleeae TaxID=1294199 RepID=UPI000C7912FD|nr:uncharacterized protein LOC111711940 isoform X2 [Eurytemora carolleeae]|eukprot:XP_023342224.1 uncharacterized protein LOC111711940 isoform X2 [Eurytemora affinis]